MKVALMPKKERGEQKADESGEMMIASNKCEISYRSCFHNKLLKMVLPFFSGEA